MTIKTKAAVKREKRNEKINELYAKYMALDGSMKSAVFEQISKELRTSITTVSRIINN